MSRAIAVLRPEPGNARTAARIEAGGGRALRLPLFTVRPLDWTPPDPAGHDALILSSANALRHGGPGLERLKVLPVLAVGEATAQAARAEGFRVIASGGGGIDALMMAARAAGVRRALHLTGRDHHSGDPAIIAATLAVYESVATPVAQQDAARLNGTVAMVHSARAAAALAALDGIDPATITLAAISAEAAAEAGEGWRTIAVAAQPHDDALVTLALGLAD